MRRLWMFWLCSSLIGCRSSEHTATVEAFEDGAHVVASTPLAVELETLAVHAVTRTAEHDRMEAASGIYDVIGFFYPRPETSARSVQGLNPKDLRGLVDAGKSQVESGIVAIVGVTEDGCEVFTYSPAGFHQPPYNVET